jgi:3-methyladenine DNA glycosylase AlkC
MHVNMTNSKPKAREKGAASRAAVTAAHRLALERGLSSTRTLSELLVMDLQRLLEAVAPQAAYGVPIDPTLGITLRMQHAATALYQSYGDEVFARFRHHESDTIRGLLAYCVPLRQDLGSAHMLEAIQPFANDAHFGVREWAWLATRPTLAKDLTCAIVLLSAWTSDTSANIRRFASEVLRPRGVWCSHISALKSEPVRALAILQPLHADPSRYVQDSLGNWLNDAAKTCPDWVKSLCAQWLAQSSSAATAYICKRALRTLKS